MTHKRAVCLMLLVTLLWSTAGVVTRHLEAARGFELTFWRSAFNALALIVVLGALRGRALLQQLLGARRAVWASGLCWAMMFTAFMVALTMTRVAHVLVVMALAPLLTALFCSFGISASYLEAVHVIGIDAGTFWRVLQDAVDFRSDYLVAFEKAAVFGGTAALVASYVGYHAEPTIEGTSIATTRAVVNASLLVLMFNFVLSALLFR